MTTIIKREKVDKEFTNYKELLIYASEHHDQEITIKVPFSRFKMLLSKHVQYKGWPFDQEVFDKEVKLYDFCKLNGFNNNNIFVIVKDCDERNEKKGFCKRCNDLKELNKDNHCYYCETITSPWYTLSMHSLR